MQPGADKIADVPARPAPFLPSNPQNPPPFTSSGPVVGVGSSRPTSPFISSRPIAGSVPSIAPGASMPNFPRAMAASDSSWIPPPVRFNGPANVPPSAYSKQDTSVYQPTQAPRFTPPAQPVPPFGITPQAGPPVIPPSGSLPSSQISPVPISIPSVASNQMTPSANFPLPPFQPSLSAPRPPGPPPQPPLQAEYNAPPRGSVPQSPVNMRFSAPGSISQPPLQTFPATRLPHHPPQGGFAAPPPPPIGAPIGFASREQMQYASAAPPLGGSVQGLIEDFQSITLGSAPGSVDPGLDFRSLPRPFDNNEETISVLEKYPFNCHPRFLRLTTHALPSSQSLLARWHLPLGIVLHPLAEVPDGDEVPIVNFGLVGIVRCRRCRTYINAYVTFTDAGRKWRCNICSLMNDVPGEYFCALDANGRRCDLEQRPELSKGSVEFVAPTEYMVRPPMPPLYFFVIDVSVSAVRSGLLEVVARTIKSCLDDLPGFPRTQIGFLTFDSTLHFYSLKSSLSQPQMMVVADLDDIFLPLPDDLLVNLSDSRNVVDAFLDSLPTMFQDNANMESAFGPALKASYMVMSQLGGKLLVFQSTLPSLGVGRLRLRGDDLRVYGTDKEHNLRIAEDSFYKQMAADFTKNQIAVDIYAFSEKYSDIASLGTLAKYTGGQVYHYPSFKAVPHQEKLKHELTRDLTRETAWEAVMRIRCTKGVRFTTYHGHFMLRSVDLLALPAVDSDKAFAMQLALEETLLTTQVVFFQVALLYTSSSGERRIRVHTAAVPVVPDLAEMYRQADTGAIISLLSRLAIENSLSNKLDDARQLIQLKIVKCLKEYRNLYAVQHRLSGRMIYPESLKLLPLYALCLCKSAALRGGFADASLDERCAAGYSMMILPIRRLLKLLYPSLIRIDEIIIKAADSEDSLKQLPLSVGSLDSRGLYICDDGFNFVFWLGQMLLADIVNKILGVDSSMFPDLSKVQFCEQDNDVTRKIKMILRQLRNSDPSYYQLLHVVRQGEQPREGILFISKLVEDQFAGGSNYSDWILQIHRQSLSP
ncbi:protein transport protein Sec24-like At3g07100 [Phalaenopsis equestris]|uniref:protein transport protein Sec24-like At3g07100 n=1 Tax=Phalaenopsis equestris TaxID=78828 RepID=UPI0009E25859|nr:protein transport protein Sec24-like At3g07100 [Phalaenopsis equestris]XP_020586674.1 protein transport protein Sec24-like At3g07100 [Phalaenopsis equestris]XP_020586683.1 protein transport protein Sec24-like At3g07100 [Phalaenopsis equestris]